MIELVPHWEFIAAAYGGAVAIVVFGPHGLDDVSCPTHQGERLADA